MDLVILIMDGEIHTTDGVILIIIGTAPIMDGVILAIMAIITTQYTDGAIQATDMDIITDILIEAQITPIMLAEEALTTLIM